MFAFDDYVLDLISLKCSYIHTNGVSVNFLAIYQQLKGIGSCQSVMAVYWGVTGLTDNSRLIEQSLFCICSPDEIYINRNIAPLFWLPCQLCIWNPNLDPDKEALLYYNIFCLLRWNTFLFLCSSASNIMMTKMMLESLRCVRHQYKRAL